MKLQPNFSWQKYENAKEDSKEQFQFQLQQEHIQVANTTNATIDDESYFSRERMTSFTWMDGQPIWKRTISGVVLSTATTPYPHGVTGINVVVKFEGAMQGEIPLATLAAPIPYIDPTDLANGVGLYMDTTNIYLITGNANWAGYLFSVTIYYTKVRT